MAKQKHIIALAVLKTGIFLPFFLEHINLTDSCMEVTCKSHVELEGREPSDSKESRTPDSYCSRKVTRAPCSLVLPAALSLEGGQWCTMLQAGLRAVGGGCVVWLFPQSCTCILRPHPFQEYIKMAIRSQTKGPASLVFYLSTVAITRCPRGRDHNR